MKNDDHTLNAEYKLLTHLAKSNISSVNIYIIYIINYIIIFLHRLTILMIYFKISIIVNFH